ncbi:MAG TPA: class I SAM-dependent methyltransferase [Pseudonocardiaceae bacterium]
MCAISPAQTPTRAVAKARLSCSSRCPARLVGLDLGTGDGRLLALLRGDRPDALGVGLDVSEPMLGAARQRFAGDRHVELIEHDLAEPLPTLRRFNVVVSSFAIHHLEHQRKRSLYGEVLHLLEPSGVFANLEHVASPTPRLYLAFIAAIGETPEEEDPSDRPTSTASQSRVWTVPVVCEARPCAYTCAMSGDDVIAVGRVVADNG